MHFVADCCGGVSGKNAVSARVELPSLKADSWLRKAALRGR
jgi:hypothetical protein